MQFTITNLTSFTNYTVSVRCIIIEKEERQLYWSEWSEEKVGTTLEGVPSRQPDLWRIIEAPDSDGYRRLHLMWKELDACEANGIILGYRVKCEQEHNPVVKEVINTTELKATCNLTQDAYLISLIAYNSAGDSPEAKLRVLAVDKAMPPVESVQAVRENGTLLVRWMAPYFPVSGYVIEWYKDSGTYQDKVDKMAWQHVHSTRNQASLQGEDFKCYNISVYPLYENGTGASKSTQAYFQEKKPIKGPMVITGDMKKTEVAIKWKEIPKEERRGFITNYTIFYGTDKGPEHSLTLNHSELQYTLSSLQPNTGYKVHVMASTSAGGENGTEITFRTLVLDTEDIIIAILPVVVIIFSMVLLGIFCVQKKRKLKHLFWPEVPNPAKSSVGNWPEDTFKPEPVAKPNDFDGPIVPNGFNIMEITPSPEKYDTEPAIKIDSSMVHECSKHPSSIYVMPELGYKRQVPSGRSMSTQLLLSDMLEEPSSNPESPLLPSSSDEQNNNQEVLGNEVFQEDVTTPYLRSSVEKRELLPNEDCLDESQREQADTAKSEIKGLLPQVGQSYVTVDMFGFNQIY
uniref:Fibronectin type-III domain-containing protein n=2 Tax=Latimeria chalumnae TaxID=7897 RepID=M3XIJ8_LATCH|nr:PREDICTED: interleukin-31 receptor subunit alpha [Latimeria chalumnae]|eukprot:XP_006007325.1 PREDICTED: interleukin-31 receptor subunit alpha [Latimeria chalumnae]